MFMDRRVPTSLSDFPARNRHGAAAVYSDTMAFARHDFGRVSYGVLAWLARSGSKRIASALKLRSCSTVPLAFPERGAKM